MKGSGVRVPASALTESLQCRRLRRSAVAGATEVLTAGDCVVDGQECRPFDALEAARLVDGASGQFVRFASVQTPPGLRRDQCIGVGAVAGPRQDGHCERRFAPSRLAAGEKPAAEPAEANTVLDTREICRRTGQERGPRPYEFAGAEAGAHLTGGSAAQSASPMAGRG